MKIFVGADHGGFAIKNEMILWLQGQGHDVEDCGAHSFIASDDYPTFAFAVAEQVAAHPESRGILFCRSGAGMVIAANKVRGVRAAVGMDTRGVAHARRDNNITVLGVSGDWSSSAEIQELIKTFLTEPGATEPRHQQRIAQITAYEDRS